VQKRRININKQETGSLLLLKLSRSSDKTAVATEQLLASLHGILNQDIIKNNRYANRVSFEIAMIDREIGFYLWVPDYLRSVVEDQLYAQYPTLQMSPVSDYAQKLKPVRSQLIAELRLANNDALPIKEHGNFKVDPLSSIVATLAELNDSEQAWIQIILTPAPLSWYNDASGYIQRLESGQSPSLLMTLLSSERPTGKVSENDKIRAKAVEEKISKPAYQTTIRIVYRGEAKFVQAKIRVQAITSSFMQFNTQNLNKFNQVYLGEKDKFIFEYTSRQFSSYISILNSEELATIYHLPHSTIDTPNIIWANSKAVEPPLNLPKVTDDMPDALKSEISPIAFTNFRGKKVKFGLPRSDRGRHLYILGQTGVGKSALLELLTIADIDSPYGFALIDPHGDYAVNILRRISKSRIKDVVYFNPADIDFPIAFNPLEIADPRLKNHICSELISVLRPIFETWNPRLEYLLRNCILALLDFPGVTMIDINRILIEPEFRDQVIPHIKDQVIARFWTHDFKDWQATYANAVIGPIINKVGGFTSNPIIRNIINNPKSSFNIREIMDSRKILIINLSRGLIGEDNAALLGSLLIASIQRAAMSRADIEDIDQRIPFYLYVDEFQNFANDSFKTILSEARKYGLMLTVANQYIEQMSQGVQEAIFGNVGSMISFRLSSEDANVMSKYYEPTFDSRDLIHLHNRHIAINMIIDGERVLPFSAETITLPVVTENNAIEVINTSRASYGVESKGADIISLVGLKNDDSQKPKTKNEIVHDIGHLIRSKTNNGGEHKSKSRVAAVKKILGKKKDAKAIELNEDQSVRLH
jgi:hypothetical protein